MSFPFLLSQITPHPHPQKRHTAWVFTLSPSAACMQPDMVESVPAAAADARATAVVFTNVRLVMSTNPPFPFRIRVLTRVFPHRMTRERAAARALLTYRVFPYAICG